MPGGPSGPVPGPAGHHMLPGEGGLAEALTHQEDAAQKVGGTPPLVRKLLERENCSFNLGLLVIVD